jgi:16S rRNA (cytidine1402-2'-O)-methyltransferase
MSDSTPRPGTLYLIPTNLSEPVENAAILPPDVVALACRLDHYIAENAKTARTFLKAIGITRPLQEVVIHELDKHARQDALEPLLEPLLAGHDVGLISEAGAPAVADPGAAIVHAAHRANIVVRPLVGPSSILLGLMASGLNGQTFAFHGYLSQEKSSRHKALAELERESKQRRMTQIFIETPYRNQALFNDLLQTLSPGTLLSIARDLTGPRELTRTMPVSAWRAASPALEKLPTLFLFLA